MYPFGRLVLMWKSTELPSHAESINMSNFAPEQLILQNIQSLPPILTPQIRSSAVLTAHAKSGELTRLMPGRYIESFRLPNVEAPSFERSQVLARINLAAGITKLKQHEVLSHRSAGILWGFPWYGSDTRVHSVRRVSKRVAREGFALHTHDVDAANLVQAGSFLVTDIKQTAIDLAANCPPSQALALLDYARGQGVSQQALVQLAQQRIGNGRKKVLKLAQLSVNNSDSPRESECRYWLYKAGVRKVTTQLHIATIRGHFYADLYVDGTPLVYEYDGESKYALRKDALVKEKLREDAIRELGYTVKRVTRQDLNHPMQFIHSVRRSLEAVGYRIADTRATDALVP